MQGFRDIKVHAGLITWNLTIFQVMNPSEKLLLAVVQIINKIHELDAACQEETMLLNQMTDMETISTRTTDTAHTESGDPPENSNMVPEEVIGNAPSVNS